MQVVNDTDETITLEPGEAIVGSVTVRSFEGTEYRVEMERVSNGPVDVSELNGVKEFVERFGGKP